MPWMRAFSAFAVTCGMLSAQPVTQVFSVEKEMALGRQLAAETRKRTTPIESVEVQGYVDRIGKRLSQGVKTPFSLTFSVVTGLSDNPVREPLVLPGGFLFVPADLVFAAHDENELAGMLAHAVAHVANRDSTRTASLYQLAGYGTVPLIFVGSWESGLAIPHGLADATREFEATADVAAVSIMRQAGYDPRALIRYIERVQPETIRKQYPFAQRNARVAALKAAVEALGSDDEFLKIQEQIRREIGDVSVRKTPSLIQ